MTQPHELIRHLVLAIEPMGPGGAAQCDLTHGDLADSRSSVLDSIRLYRQGDLAGAIERAVYAYRASHAQDEAQACRHLPCIGDDLQEALDDWLVFLRRAGDIPPTQQLQNRSWPGMSPEEQAQATAEHLALLGRADQQLRDAALRQSLLTPAQIAQASMKSRNGDLWPHLLDVGGISGKALFAALLREQGLEAYLGK